MSGAPNPANPLPYKRLHPVPRLAGGPERALPINLGTNPASPYPL
jgi:hypothetical protein